MMIARLPALLLALLAPLVLLGCVVTPGKFVSTLTINADRSFAYTYRGEVYALDLGKEMRGLKDATDDAEPEVVPTTQPVAWTQDKPATPPNPDTERKNAAIADALRKEPGYTRVEYKGGGRFEIDYAIRGSLTHSFVWPYNLDAEVIIPFLSIELAWSRHGAREGTGVCRRRVQGNARRRRDARHGQRPRQARRPVHPHHRCRDRQPEQRGRRQARHGRQGDRVEGDPADEGCAAGGVAGGARTRRCREGPLLAARRTGSWSKGLGERWRYLWM